MKIYRFTPENVLARYTFCIFLFYQLEYNLCLDLFGAMIVIRYRICVLAYQCRKLCVLAYQCRVSVTLSLDSTLLKPLHYPDYHIPLLHFLFWIMNSPS